MRGLGVAFLLLLVPTALAAPVLTGAGSTRFEWGEAWDHTPGCDMTTVLHYDASSGVAAMDYTGCLFAAWTFGLVQGGSCAVLENATLHCSDEVRGRRTHDLYFEADGDYLHRFGSFYTARGTLARVG